MSDRVKEWYEAKPGASLEMRWTGFNRRWRGGFRVGPKCEQCDWFSSVPATCFQPSPSYTDGEIKVH